MPWLYKAFKVKRENLGRGREAVAIVHHIHFASLGTNLIGIKQGQGQYNSVQSLSRVWLFVTPWTAAHQATRSITRVYSNSCPLSRWWHPTISSSVISFSSCLQSFPASSSFPMSRLFASRGQSIGASDSASDLPVTIQGWFPSRLTGLISLQSKGLSRVSSNITVQKHQIFGAQLSL